MRKTVISALALILVSHGAAVADPRSGTGISQQQHQKWVPDASLRQGMEAIGGLIGKALDKKPGAEEYPRMAASIEASLDDITRNCKLPQEADEQLHPVLARMIDGVALMKQGERPEAGFAVMLGAL
ncbi:MAG: hypothetical protein K2X44_04810, partial [Magnetospirillum sp.]|nr:hypothetical protein [Magnetospirillum sp.]